MSYRAFVYRIYPTKEQEDRLLRWEGTLRFLWNLAHEQRLLGLAKPRGLSPATASRALFQLSQRGYVVLTPDSADRRRVVITRTAEGTKALSFLYREIQKGLPK